MADTFKGGKDGKVTVNATEVAITGWSVNASTEIIRFRNSRTGNYDQKDATFKDASGSFTIDYDFDASPFGSPLTLTPGTQLTNLILYLDGLAGKKWTFPSAIVAGTPQSLDVGGRIETSVNFEADGSWTPPT